MTIILPLARAPLSAVGLLLATAAWNEYVGFVMYISDRSKINLQYRIRNGIAEALNPNIFDCFAIAPTWTAICVYIVLAILPALIICPLFLKNIFPTLEMTMVKD